MKVIRLTLGQLQTNCYIAVCEQTNKCLVIDPADEGGYLAEKIMASDWQLVAMVATHGHFDHILGSLELKLALGVPFLIHQDDEFLLKQARSSAKHWLRMEIDPAAPVDAYLKEDQILEFGGQQMKVIHTPGHTPGSISLYHEKEGVLFSGDTLFAGSNVGRTDFKYSSAMELAKSVKKLLALPEETVIYSGHGEEGTVSQEREMHGYNIGLD